MTATRIWKFTDAWRGYGNGYKATITELVYTDEVMVDIHEGHRLVSATTHTNLQSGKRWADKHYLKA